LREGRKKARDTRKEEKEVKGGRKRREDGSELREGRKEIERRKDIGGGREGGTEGGFKSTCISMTK
jgi:hypothetical protein